MDELILANVKSVTLSLRLTQPSSDDKHDSIADALVLRHPGENGAHHALVLEGNVVIPAALKSADGSRLLEKEEIEAKIAESAAKAENATDTLSREAAATELQVFESARTALRDALKTRVVKIDVEEAGPAFFGIRSIAGARFSATARLNLAALTDYIDGELSKPDAVIFEATALASISAGNATATLLLSVRLSNAGLLKLLPSLDLPALAFPGLPKLDLDWPEMPLPSFNLNQQWPFGLDRLLRLELPMPGSPPIRIDWDGEPSLTFEVSPRGELTLHAGDRLNGNVIVMVGTVETRLATIAGFDLTVDSNGLRLEGSLGANSQVSTEINIDVNDPQLPLVLRSQGATVSASMTGQYDLENKTGDLKTLIVLDVPRLLIEARDDPRVFLTLSFRYETTIASAADSPTGRLTKLRVIEPYPVELIAAGVAQAIAGVMRFVALIRLADADVPGLPAMSDPRPLLKRLGEFVAVIARWVARQAGTVGGMLADLGEAAMDLLGKILELLTSGPSLPDTLVSHVAIDIRLDARTYALRQIWLTPVHGQAVADHHDVQALGLHLEVPRAWKPALVIDMSGDKPLVALVVRPQIAGGDATLSTDLWYERAGGPTEAVRDSNRKPRPEDRPPIQSNGKVRPEDQPLIQISVKATGNDLAVALVCVDEGKVSFLRKVIEVPSSEAILAAGAAAPGGQFTLSLLKERLTLRDLKVGAMDADGVDIRVGVKIHSDAKNRLLPFLAAPPAEGAKLPDNTLPSLGQYIQIREVSKDAAIMDGRAVLPIDVSVKLADYSADTTLTVSLDLSTFKARLDGGTELKLYAKPEAKKLLGLDAKFVPRKDSTVNPRNQQEIHVFTLDFRGGDVRLVMAPTVDLELWYSRIASEGRGLVFKVDDFAIGRSGIDLVARADRDVPVTLAGVEVPFRFTEGGVTIKGSRLNAFSVTGKGQLPPRLIGEANLTAMISFGPKDGRLAFQGAEVILDKGSDPIECKNTRFSLALQKVELNARDFDGDGIHFWFALTGSARFTPGGDEFKRGLLQYLDQLEIVFDKAPLTTNAALLSRSLDFHIGVRMKRSINFFNIFKFELRGFGFHPSVPRFGDKPALSISGQMDFMKVGDVVSPKIDFHKLWIAPPKPGRALPQIAFDGLGVQLTFGNAKLDATAVAVDGNLPSLDPSITYPEPITAEGFLAQGRLAIAGWAPMAASAGFLEMNAKGGLRHAFFAFAQMEQQSIEIPTPIGTFYLREVGFGFGFRYTFAGLVAADMVKSPDQLVKVLDDVAKRQGDLASFKAWAPEPDGNRLTLAMRALFTVASISKSGTLNAKERLLSNVLLFDVAAALRSDLTFLMTARGWINTNYYTWVNGELGEDGKVKLAPESIRSRPPLIGYVYISVPRKQFLGRLIADGTGYLGKTPDLNALLREAMAGVSWSATLFMQPGLFHFEMGWPYELSFEFKRKSEPAEIFVSMQGGMIFRIEDASMLYGIAFRGKGYAQLGGEAGGSSFGASAVARVDLSLQAKFIAYIPALEPKQTLFYGAVDFAVTMSIRVKVWLRIKILRKRISFELRFSIVRTLELAVELAISPEDTGGRATASMAISAFGRTLRLGVTMGFNEGALEKARLKVERFLAIGLDAAPPEPSAGLRLPQPPVPPSKAADDVETVIQANDRKYELQAKVATSEEIHPPLFWALLFEIPENRRIDPEQREFVLTLIPRDDTDTPITGPATKSEILERPKGTFFAPPPPVNEAGDTKRNPGMVDYVLHLDHPETFGLRHLTLDHGEKSLRNVKEQISMNDEGYVAEGLRLALFLHDCFIIEKKNGEDYVTVMDTEGLDTTSDIYRLRQPQQIGVKPERKPLPRDRAKATEEMRCAALDQTIAPNPYSAYAREVEERRSAVISAIGESAAALAAKVGIAVGETGKRHYVWPDRADKGFDARDFGLTFVATADEIDKLFVVDNVDNAVQDTAATTKPRHARFSIQTRKSQSNDASPGGSHKPLLLNPPARFFAVAQPRLAGQEAGELPKAVLTKNGIELRWNLEPRWGDSVGPYHDPEYLLRHYRIRRIVLDEDEELALYELPPVETKSGSLLALDPDVGQWRALGLSAHFIDTLDDIAKIEPELANALLHRGDDPLTDWERAKAGNYTLRYDVIAVDIAGSESTPQSVFFWPKEPAPRIVPLMKAELIFNYSVLNDATATTQAKPRLFLRIDDLLARAVAKAGEQPMRLQKDNSRYELVFRRETAVSGGIYGVDALARARQRPSPAEMNLPRPADDFAVFVTFMNVASVLPDDQTGIGRKVSPADRFQPLEIYHKQVDVSPVRGRAYLQIEKKGLTNQEAYDALLKFLGTAAGNVISAYRVGVRRIECVRDVEDLTLERPGIEGKAASGFLFADLSLLIAPPEQRDDGERANGDRTPVETMVEVFEHPRAVRFNALGFSDLDGEGGQISVLHPGPDATLENSGFRPDTQGQSPPAFVHLVDSKRRTATRVRWNSGPSESATYTLDASTASAKIADPSAYAPLIGGFDVFETDLSELASMDQVAEYARRIARVQRLPDGEGTLDPAEITDFEKVEAYYPSEAKRRLTAQNLRREEERLPWYSPAETFLRWPKFCLRRSLGLAVVEAELMPLFDQGKPTRIRISFDQEKSSWAYPQERPANMPEGEIPRVWIAPQNAKQQDTDEFVGPDADRKWSISSLIDLLRTLVWRTNVDLDKKYSENPEIFATCVLKLESLGTDNKPLIATLISVDLLPAVHPFLADVLDAVRWHKSKKDKWCRFYEPVLDAAPPTKAKTLEDFMNERPPERDPYGWAFLRTIGLSTGLRLFDLEKLEFADPNIAIERIAAAIELIRPRYSNIGQPMVEFITRPDGLIQLSSFDSAIPQNGLNAKTFMENQALALMQVSLRPVPEQLVLEDNPAPECVAYYLLSLNPPDEANPDPIPQVVTIRLNGSPPAANGAVLCEIIDIANGVAGAAPRALIHAEDAAGKVLFADFKPTDAMTIRAEGQVGRIALVRITAIGSAQIENAAQQIEVSDASDETRILSVTRELRTRPSAIAADVNIANANYDPFGRFPSLQPRLLQLIHAGGQYKMGNEVRTIDPKPNAKAQLANLLEAVALRFSEDKGIYDTLDEDGKVGFLSKLQQFSARLIEHGPCVAGSLDTLRGTPFALAAVTRPDPWRVAPREDGTMDVLLVHEDGWARRRRYVVRPFGRYENIEMAMKSANGKNEEVEPLSLHDLRSKVDASFSARSVDITTPRTQPLRSPVFISARRLDSLRHPPQDKSDSISIARCELLERDPKRRREGRQLEYVLARHAEEIVSESNRKAADAYQFDHVGIAFYREFAAPRWALGLTRVDGFGSVQNMSDMLAPLLAAGGQRPEPLALSYLGDDFKEAGEGVDARFDAILPDRIIDGWRGITAVRTADVPYFYRLHAVAHASAGVVVSEPVAATIPEGRPHPRLPWRKKQPKMFATESPSWCVIRSDTTFKVQITVPLLRHIDALSDADTSLWLDADAIPPPVFSLPDANATYVLALETSLGGPTADFMRQSRSVEAELLPIVPENDEDAACYRITAAGSRFEAIGNATAQVHYLARQSEGKVDVWTATIDLAPKQRLQSSPPADQAPVAVALPVLLNEAQALLDRLELNAGAIWETWLAYAPRRAAKVRIRRPEGALNPLNPIIDWNPFTQEIHSLITNYRRYPTAANDGILAALTPFDFTGLKPAACDALWETLAGSGLDAVRDIADWRSGLPFSAASDGGTLKHYSVTFDSQWASVGEIDVKFREALLRCAGALLGGAQIVADIRADIDATCAMLFRPYSQVAADAETRPFHGVPPITAPIAPDKPLAILEQLGKPGKPEPTRLPVSMEVVQQCLLEAGADEQWTDPRRAALVDLIAVLESLLPAAGMARALASLEAVRTGDAVSTSSPQPLVEIILTHTVIADPMVADAITALAGTFGTVVVWGAPTALILRSPPNDRPDTVSGTATSTELADFDKIVDLLQGADKERADKERAKAEVRRLAAEQLFGPKRRLTVSIFRGLAEPLVDIVERK